MRLIDYTFASNLPKTTLDDLYKNTGSASSVLKEAIRIIVETEAPITKNTLKARIRENVLGIGKISAGCLAIIDEQIESLGLVSTDNLFDVTLWPASGVFDLDYIRKSDRQIYDIPLEEIANLASKLMNEGKAGEALYREMLKFFGYEVLTKKAEEYLSFVENALN